MNGALRAEQTGKQCEPAHLPHPQLLLGIPAEEGRQGLPGDTPGSADGDVRMKPAEVRLQAGVKDGILDVLVKGKQVWMPVTDSGPHHGRVGSAKGAQASDWQEEGRDLYLTERLTQSLLIPSLDIAEEAQGEMHLLGGEPPDSSHPGIK